MLQQTRVEAVIPYYRRFLARFPSIRKLAAAPLDDVLKQWEGLGYYARARNLHRAAQAVAAHHRGRFPRDLKSVQALPGIGRSTAGSILCFAFGQRHPVLDGNVKRVLLRLYDVALDKSRPAVERWLWRAAQTLLVGAEVAYDYNQAAIELGATVCTPTSPQCPDCPIRKWCFARRAGSQHEIPFRPPTRRTPHYTIGIGVVHRRGKIFIQRRPPEGLLGGLWEFPGGKRVGREPLTETVRRELAEELGIDVEVGLKIARVEHAYTHFRITLHAYHCQHLRGTPRPTAADAWRWVPLARLPRYAFPRANQRVLERLLQGKSYP